MENPWVGTIAFVTMFVVLIIMACCGEMRRKTPHNFIFLAMFTAAQGLMLGIVATAYDSNEVRWDIELEAWVVTNKLIIMSTGSQGGWYHMCHLCRPDPVLVPDQVGFHCHGRFLVCGFVGGIHFRNHSSVLPGKCGKLGLFRLWSATVLVVFDLRYAAYDWRKSQVFDQPGGIHLCGA